jgi:hypothetical protein
VTTWDRAVDTVDVSNVAFGTNANLLRKLSGSETVLSPTSIQYDVDLFGTPGPGALKLNSPWAYPFDGWVRGSVDGLNSDPIENFTITQVA